MYIDFLLKGSLFILSSDHLSPSSCLYLILDKQTNISKYHTAWMSFSRMFIDIRSLFTDVPMWGQGLVCLWTD